MTQYIMGITALHHDSSVALIDNQGVVINAAKQSSFSGIHNDSAWPQDAIDWAIKDAKARGYDITPKDIAYNYYENPWVKFKRKMVANPAGAMKYMKEVNEPQSHIKKINFIDHHEAHALTAVVTSPFSEGYYIIADGAGDDKCISWGTFAHNKIAEIGCTKYPHSLGILHAAVMDLFSLKPNKDDWKWDAFGGTVCDNYVEKLEALVVMENGTITLNPLVKNRGGLADVFGSEFAVTDIGDLAASVNKVMLDALDYICRWHFEDRNMPLVFGGGLASNGFLANALGDTVRHSQYWVPPYPGNGGSAIGAAFAGLTNIRTNNYHSNFHGPVVDDCVKVVPMLLKNVAKRLEAGEVIGWMQGPEEFTANAAGHRMIMADPRNKDACEKMSEICGKTLHHNDVALVLAEMANSYFSPEPGTDFDSGMFEHRLRSADSYAGMLSYTRVLALPKGLDCSRALLATWSNSTSCDMLACNNMANHTKGIVIGTRKHAMDFLLSSDLDCMVIGNRIYYKIQTMGDDGAASAIAHYDDYSLGVFNI